MRALLLPLALWLLFLTPLPATGDEVSDTKKEFKRLLRQETWQGRASAYDSLAMIDSAVAVEEALKALVKEKNAAVVVAGIRMLSQLRSDEAVSALRKYAAKPKGKRGFYTLLSLTRMQGEAGSEELLSLVGTQKDLPMAAQAAVALGRKQIHAAIAPLVALLGHKDWQMRTAGARGLFLMAGPIPEEPKPKAAPAPWVPAWLKVDEVLAPLVTALEAADGSDRRPLIQALERLTRQDFGYDPAAWRAYADGVEPDQIQRKPKTVPHIVGFPVYGKRVIFLIDNVTSTDDPVPYRDRNRLKELCDVPGARRVPWFSIKTTRDFMHAHLKRAVMDLTGKGVKFEVVVIGNRGHLTFGKLQSSNRGTRMAIGTMLEKLKVESGNDTFDALSVALDISGKGDKAAWTRGPDELIYLTCTVPWLGAEFEDPDVVGSAIGLRAWRRMVPIHTIGIGPHPRGLTAAVSDLSGGVYISRER